MHNEVACDCCHSKNKITYKNRIYIIHDVLCEFYDYELSKINSEIGFEFDSINTFLKCFKTEKSDFKKIKEKILYLKNNNKKINFNNLSKYLSEIHPFKLNLLINLNKIKLE